MSASMRFFKEKNEVGNKLEAEKQDFGTLEKRETDDDFRKLENRKVGNQILETPNKTENQGKTGREQFREKLQVPQQKKSDAGEQLISENKKKDSGSEANGAPDIGQKERVAWEKGNQIPEKRDCQNSEELEL